MARVIRIHAHGGPEVLKIETVPTPEPKAGQVRLSVRALGLNRAEVLMRTGRYIESPLLPSGLGLEAAGVIDAVGEGVAGLAVGDAVSLIPPVSMAAWPTYGHQMVFPASMVVRHPACLGWDEAAALWMAYLTAYGALVEVARVTAGEAVIITAASSSVGMAAIQIARSLGAKSVAVTRTVGKADALKAAGAASVVVSDVPGFEDRLRLACDGPARVVFDAVAGTLFEPLTAVMAPGGILIEYGGLAKEPTPFPLGAVLGKSLTLRGYLVHEVVTDPARLERAKAFIAAGVEIGALRPIIDRVFGFEEMAEAHRYLEGNAQIGKVVVKV